MRSVTSRFVTSSPLGPLELRAGPAGIVSLRYDADEGPAPSAPPPPALADAAAQLAEWFTGARRDFELPLDLGGTPFERRVWHELRAIPFAETVTYAELARAVGRPEVVRAVAGAVARTPVPIIVPCHRVVGSDGALRGYVGGLERKAALLERERLALWYNAHMAPPG